MANLPSSSVTPGPPFSAIGVDTFGPWSIVTRKTRGAESNRWAIMFTCLTTRANHIKVDGIHVKLIIHQSLRKKKLPSVEMLENCDLTVAQTSLKLQKILTQK